MKSSCKMRRAFLLFLYVSLKVWSAGTIQKTRQGLFTINHAKDNRSHLQPLKHPHTLLKNPTLDLQIPQPLHLTLPHARPNTAALHILNNLHLPLPVLPRPLQFIRDLPCLAAWVLDILHSHVHGGLLAHGADDAARGRRGRSIFACALQR